MESDTTEVTEQAFIPWTGDSHVAPTQDTEETQLDPWVGEVPLVEEAATLSSILAWEIPCTEKPQGLQSQTRVSAP